MDPEFYWPLAGPWRDIRRPRGLFDSINPGEPTRRERDPDKLGPPSQPHPWTLNWWIDSLLAFTPVGAGMDLAKAMDDFERLPPDATPRQKQQIALSGLLAAIGMVPASPIGNLPKRLAQADAMGFRRNMPIAIGTARAGERVMPQPAVRLADGRTLTGADHWSIYQDYGRQTGRTFKDFDDVPRAELAPISEGFLTSDGRFVGRHEAASMYWADRKNVWTPHGLTTGDVTQGKVTGPRPRYHVATTEEGLPGIEGVWGRLNSPRLEAAPSVHPGAATGPSAPATVTAWHRTTNPVSVDAAGASQAELSATLKDAWLSGHDAVMLKNYTRPGGTAPETVIVVKDRAQLRLPDARFDPAQIGSPNLKAGLIPLALAGGLGLAPQEAQPRGMFDGVP